MSFTKFDHDKAPMFEFSTYDRIVLENESRCLKLGADKYGRHNWHQADLDVGIERYIAAALRHIMAMMNEEYIDSESGLPHTAHVRCCMGFLEHFILMKQFRNEVSPEVTPSPGG